MDRSQELIKARLRALDLAERLGNISEACRRSGMNRTSFYAWKKRYEERGIDGLKDEPPVHKTHPQTTPSAMRKRIETIALKHPSYGCNRIAVALAKTRHTVSAVTIQNIMSSAGLGTRRDRWLLLESRYATSKAKLTPEQTAFVAQMNPCFRERYAWPSLPGEIVTCGVFSMGRIPAGRLHLHLAIDVFSNYAYAILDPSKSSQLAADALHSLSYPLGRYSGSRMQQVVTGGDRWFFGPNPHPFRLYVAVNGFPHKAVKGLSWVHASAERFHRIAMDEYLTVTRNCHRSLSLDEAIAQFGLWLRAYNHERAHPGFPNYGRSPADVLKSCVSKEGLETG